jgi:acyl-CoA thioester hydrolase
MAGEAPPPDRPLVIERPFAVKTYDIDFAGIVSNIVFIRWLEDLRLAMLDEFFPLEPQLEKGYGPVLVRTEIDYLQPVRMFAQVVGRMWLAETGRAKWMLQAEFASAGHVVARARQIGVFVEYATMKPIPVPDHLRSSTGSGVGNARTPDDRSEET